MQTFLPYPDFAKSARVLDNKRLGKQRGETLQIFQAMLSRRVLSHTTEVGPRGGIRKVDLPREEWTIEHTYVGWANHPATKMWQNEGFALLEYQTAICNEWVSRGYKDTCLAKTEMVFLDAVDVVNMGMGAPRWVGDEAFHASHRSALLRKNPEWYGQWGWTERDDLEYVWPR